MTYSRWRDEIIDIDFTREDSPIHCTVYVNEIYQFLKENEVRYLPKKDFLALVQPDLSEEMRAVLFDWLVEVAEEYQISTETLFLSKNYIDRYLSQVAVTKGKLQLLGIASMLIASKYEEVYAPAVDDFVYISDNTYNRSEILQMELTVLKVLDYTLAASSENIFLRRFQRAAAANVDNRSTLNKVVMLSNYLAELTMTEYSFVGTLPSIIASAAISIALYLLKLRPWTATLQYYTGIDFNDASFQNCWRNLVDVFGRARTSHFKAIINKYAQKILVCFRNSLSFFS